MAPPVPQSALVLEIPNRCTKRQINQWLTTNSFETSADIDFLTVAKDHNDVSVALLHTRRLATKTIEPGELRPKNVYLFEVTPTDVKPAKRVESISNTTESAEAKKAVKMEAQCLNIRGNVYVAQMRGWFAKGLDWIWNILRTACNWVSAAAKSAVNAAANYSVLASGADETAKLLNSTAAAYTTALNVLTIFGIVAGCVASCFAAYNWWKAAQSMNYFELLWNTWKTRQAHLQVVYRRVVDCSVNGDKDGYSQARSEYCVLTKLQCDTLRDLRRPLQDGTQGAQGQQKESNLGQAAAMLSVSIAANCWNPFALLGTLIPAAVYFLLEYQTDYTIWRLKKIVALAQELEHEMTSFSPEAVLPVRGAVLQNKYRKPSLDRLVRISSKAQLLAQEIDLILLGGWGLRWKHLGDCMNRAWDSAVAAWQWVKTGVSNFFNKMKTAEGRAEIYAGARRIASAAVGVVVDAAKAVGRAVVSAVSAVYNWFRSWW